MQVVDDYFAALARRDADAMADLRAPDGVDHIAGQGDAVSGFRVVHVPGDVRAQLLRAASA